MNNNHETQTLLSMSEVAATLNCGLGKNRLFAFLRKKKILQNNNIAFPQYCIKGYFSTYLKRVPTKFGTSKTFLVTLVTESGLAFIKQLLNDTEVEENEIQTQRVLGSDEMRITEMVEIGNFLFPIGKVVKYDSLNELLYPRWIFDMPKPRI